MKNKDKYNTRDQPYPQDEASPPNATDAAEKSMKKPTFKSLQNEAF